MELYKLDVKKLEDVEEVKRCYRIATDALVTAEEDRLFDEDGCYNTELTERINFLRNLVASLRSRVYELIEPTLSDENIDLYLDRVDSYTICEHDKTVPVGTIAYEKGSRPNVVGSLSYSIEKEYRGNNYGLRAIRLVGKNLLDKGVSKIIITPKNNDNIPTVSILEEFGGRILPEEPSYVPTAHIEATSMFRK